MPNFGPYESEVAYLSGIMDANTAAARTYETLEYNRDGTVLVPAEYGNTSAASKWGNPTPGTPGGNITYSFDPAANWSSAEQSVWSGAFGLWSALADISFSVVAEAENANITIKRLPTGKAYADTGNTAKVAVGSPTISPIPTTGAYITIDTTANGFGPLDGGRSAKAGAPWATVVHEIGHILGLGHAGPYNFTLNPEQQQAGPYDTTQWSVMSYVPVVFTDTRFFADYPVPGTFWGVTPDGDYNYQAVAPQMLDILAIQRLYGAQAGGPFSGGQIYGFGSNFTDPFLTNLYDFGPGNNPPAIITIWNSGTNNTLDLSGFAQDAMVNLTPGTFSSAGGNTNNIAIALDTLVATAIGGTGNDLIQANSALASTLNGGPGKDTLTGGAQADTLDGDIGIDTLSGLAGDDTMNGGIGDDTLDGGAGNDTMNGGDGADVMDGGPGADTMTGGNGPDVFQFSAGEANGDTLIDFRSIETDVLQFFGFGPGATFGQVDATTWQIVPGGGGPVETITVSAGTVIGPGDYTFFEAYTPLSTSTFLDLTSWRTNDTSGPSGVAITAPVTLNVALVLERANDPAALLGQGWAARAKALAELNASDTLWSTYGADQTKYNVAQNALAALGISTIDQVAPGNGYVSTQDSRTIWVQVTQDTFPTLFGPQAVLMAQTAQGDGGWFWNGSLSLPTSLTDAGVTGLWFDTNAFNPSLADPGTSLTPFDAKQGSQSTGNAANPNAQLLPQQIAGYYNLPLSSGVATGTVGLLEPAVGTALPNDPTGAGFQAALDSYRTAAGVPTGAQASAVAPGGQIYSPATLANAGERSLDVGVLATVAPNSPLILYAGSGSAGNAAGTAFTAYQSAFWDTANNPAVVSSSINYLNQVAPGSPFYKAASGLFVDAALRGITVFNANGDGGSGNQYANGLTNIGTTRSSAYVVTVGGTSFSTTATALLDGTLQSDVTKASAGDLTTIWNLVAGGMTQSPVNLQAGTAGFIETAWNQYVLNGTTFSNSSGTGYLSTNAGSGGADPTQVRPWYQTEYGLVPFTQDPYHLVGRGTPDVSADAGGNTFYLVPSPDMVRIFGVGGTSAAAPLWAALATQVNAIFNDQGLPTLGYMTDLLYIASAIAPASFNDITTGNNTSSYVNGGAYTSDGQPIMPTGYGSEAKAGYDLATGLGTPNGMLLARALTQVGHHEMFFADVAPLVARTGDGGWASAADQTLLIQIATVAKMDVILEIGTGITTLPDGTVADKFAWTARFAQQSLQADFDPDLVRMFDKQAQGWVSSSAADKGAALAAIIGQGEGLMKQADLTSAYGLADFSTVPFKSADEPGTPEVYKTGGTVHLARAVAVAETAAGADDQNAVVRVRQNGSDDLAVSFYKVDDLSGAIGGLKPGDPGYAAAATARLYQLEGGGTALQGPGYGLYTQAEIVNVDAGDLVAMKLVNHSSATTYFAFGQANPDRLGHLYNYGANTWGFEDTLGGGDRDFNDMVVQLDFTSAAGHGWLV